MVSIYDLSVQCGSCEEIVGAERPEKRLKYILSCVTLFAIIGGAVGTVVGIATAGVGFATWGITLPAGIYIGYKLGDWGAESLDGPSCPECGSSFESGSWMPFLG